MGSGAGRWAETTERVNVAAAMARCQQGGGAE